VMNREMKLWAPRDAMCMWAWETTAKGAQGPRYRGGVNSHCPPKTGVLLCERRGSGKGIVEYAGDWSYLIQTRKKKSLHRLPR
jgi:hypothetical protein